MLAPAFSTHLCLGAPYGWSAISSLLSREQGFVSPASLDWSMEACTWPMAIMIASGGLSAAFLGPWTVRAGLRKSVVTGALLFGTGMSISGLGVALHSLPLLYAGNVVSGFGYGCAYTPPLQAMINWFPDRKGLASGLVIAGFGSGALVFTPLVSAMSSFFRSSPTYLGSTLATSISPSGNLMAEISGSLVEVVHCTAAELSKLPYGQMSEGFYLVNSGNTGISAALTVAAVGYAAVITASGFALRLPPKNYAEQFTIKGGSLLSDIGRNVRVENVLSTPQFWFLFSSATILATGGMGLMSVAKPMIQEIFSSTLPSLVTPTFASLYLMSLAVANLGGRVVWAALSDQIGCRHTFSLLCCLSLPSFLSIPHFVSLCLQDPSSPLASYYLFGFCASSFLAVSVMGGVFSVLPPYEAHLYGSKYVGAIHGRFLPFSTIRGLAGPAIVLHLRKEQEYDAVQKLLAEIPPDLFEAKFGVDISQAQLLLDTQVLSLERLSAVMHSDGGCGSAMLYDSGMNTMAVLAVLALACNLAVRPVHPKHFEKLAPLK